MADRRAPSPQSFVGSSVSATSAAPVTYTGDPRPHAGSALLRVIGAVVLVGGPCAEHEQKLEGYLKNPDAFDN